MYVNIPEYFSLRVNFN